MEPTLAQVHKTVIDVNEKTNKMLEGLYGPLNKPGTGFINETNTRLKILTHNVDELLQDKEERKTSKKWTFRTAMAAVFGAVIALIKTFFFNGG